MSPRHAAARDARIAALRALADAETNPPARDWYYTSAHTLAGDFSVPRREGKPSAAMLAGMPLRVFFDGMAVNLHAEDTLDQVIRVGLIFTDPDARYTYTVRRGVSELQPGIADDVALQVRVPTQVFKETLAGLRSPAWRSPATSTWSAAASSTSSASCSCSSRNESAAAARRRRHYWNVNTPSQIVSDSGRRGLGDSRDCSFSGSALSGPGLPIATIASTLKPSGICKRVAAAA